MSGSKQTGGNAQFLAKAFELCRMSGGAKSLVETYVMQSRLQQAQGDLDNAYQSLTQAERAYHLKASMLTRFRLKSQKARLNLEAGLLDDVIHWVRGLERARAEAESALHLPIIFHEVVQLILARVYLAKGEPENALLVLEQLQTPAETEGRFKHVNRNLYSQITRSPGAQTKPGCFRACCAKP